MKKYGLWSLYISVLLFSASCNTLYNSRSVNLEIVEPGKAIFPDWVKTIAVRYNNSNVSYNPNFESHIVNSRVMAGKTNSDSIASEIYFNAFLQSLKNSFLFDSISEINKGNYSNTGFKISEQKKLDSTNDSNSVSKQATELLSDLLIKYSPNRPNPKNTVIIDPEYGLYTKDDLSEIRDSTGADLLLSLDHFAMIEEIRSRLYINTYISTQWNFFDLREKKLPYFYHRTDTITWACNFALNLNGEISARNVGISDAARASGQRFAEFLTPHWIQVSRTFYQSGNVEMKKAEQLSNEYQWLEAAKIWKVNTKNPNKNIAAKSMFNLALACEIEGNLDAAIDWVAKSYKVFEQKNQVHEFNCYEYIRVLAQRKLDLRKINIQLNQKETDL